LTPIFSCWLQDEVKDWAKQWVEVKRVTEELDCIPQYAERKVGEEITKLDNSIVLSTEGGFFEKTEDDRRRFLQDIPSKPIYSTVVVRILPLLFLFPFFAFLIFLSCLFLVLLV
jgi:hypothetical protein